MTTESQEYFEKSIEKMLNAYNGNDTAIVKYRYKLFSEIYNYYLENGFPKSLTEKKLSLIPSNFQEAIYDGIDWFKQNSDLGHMAVDFEIDCIFQNEGKRRSELTTEEFKKYVSYSDNIIDKATKG